MLCKIVLTLKYHRQLEGEMAYQVSAFKWKMVRGQVRWVCFNARYFVCNNSLLIAKKMIISINRRWTCVFPFHLRVPTKGKSRTVHFQFFSTRLAF